ncbi:RpnC/YadD family protein [Frigoriglobus tundricola]|uniref:Uncharacterized protein n=1 Tax=Frigoriglobus tundricola TaxID=2774151 RepID=A0A6M5YLZ2_9BACT|nr:hypothetical protein [Frigoriglobus tundricola]QJW94323.1 hypothetical protein FTUN_1843 [Frigoriglobus tundricola]
MRFQYDKGGKWLIEHHAGAILQLAGIGPVISVKAVPGELVQSRQLPDGLVEARLAGRSEPVLCLIEINTYSYASTANELLDDVLLTYLNRRVVPDVIALTLHDRGNVRVAPGVRLDSPLGYARLEAGWRLVNLWELSADRFLPLTDPGMAPWVALMKIDGPPEPVLQQCKDVIEAKTAGGDLENLRVTMQLLGGLRFDKELLKKLFARKDAMIESPVLQEWLQEQDVKTRQGVVLRKLERSFGPVPADVSAAVRVVTDLLRLEALLDAAYVSTSLADFRARLVPSPQTPAAPAPTN